MRPRRFGRGEPLWRAAHRVRVWPFNAATAFRPWRTRTAPGSRGSHRWSFNAATAFRPWRTGLKCPYSKYSFTFNAATAFRPWRTHQWRGQVPDTGIPSMRPRRFGRGEPERLARVVRTLQEPSMRPRRFGRGEQPPTVTVKVEGKWSFNAATAFRPWRTSAVFFNLTPPTSLQCGHGVSAVENLAFRWGRFGTGSLQCGHGVSAVENRPPRAAQPAAGSPSMRPRRFGRGELSFDGETIAKFIYLQCGHGVSAVENAEARVRPLPRVRPSMRPRRFGRGERRSGSRRRLRRSCLQCGHGVSAVENSWEARKNLAQYYAFNAATAFRPWRTSNIFRQTSSRPCRLQCGHGVSAVENMISAAGTIIK